MPDENTTEQPNQVRPIPPKKVRFTRIPRFLVGVEGLVKMELSPEALHVFNQIMDMTDDEPNDIIRKAILLYKVALETHQQGKAVGAAATPDVLDTEFVGF